MGVASESDGILGVQGKGEAKVAGEADICQRSQNNGPRVGNCRLVFWQVTPGWRLVWCVAALPGCTGRMPKGNQDKRTSEMCC